MKSIEDIKALLNRYEAPYRSFSIQDINDMYEVYNNIHEKKEKDINCPACREEIYKKLYLIYKDKNNNNNGDNEPK